MNATENTRQSDNPYAPPIWRQAGEYDHSLFWRIVKVWACIVAIVIVLEAFMFETWRRQTHAGRPHMRPAELVQKFFTDWQAFPDKSKQPR